MGRQFPIPQLSERLEALGATDVLVKHLAPNDNSKNQIYLAGDISALGLLPTGDVEFNPGTSQKPGASKRGPIFRAALNLWWMWPDRIVPAPNTKLILYPQYSEVRMSGFLSACERPPSELFDIHKRGRELGRVLILVPLQDGRIIAAVFDSDAPEAKSLRSVKGDPYGVMQRFELSRRDSTESSEQLLLSELRRIHHLGWLDPVYRLRDGSFKPCKGSNCGGVTLESHLGITANGFAEPDFHGWEVKQHNVPNWQKPGTNVITLMTPEPSGGAYKEKGPEYFVRTWGYEDQLGRPDRLNFGGVYRSGLPAHKLTGLRLIVDGYDESTGAFAGDGAVVLVDGKERVAASWSFAKLIDHWKRKHAQAVFVPSMLKKDPTARYCYGSRVTLAEGGKFNHLLRGFAYGSVYYDPGIKLEDASTSKPRLKRRSQFRVKSTHLDTLYERTRIVDL